MLSSEQNKLVTEVENGSPCGQLLRNYWQPAALTEELTSFRAAKAVRIFGEDLVVFRDGEVLDSAISRDGTLYFFIKVSRKFFGRLSIS